MDYQIAVVDEDGNDVDTPFNLTQEMKTNPYVLISKINEIISSNESDSESDDDKPDNLDDDEEDND